MIFALLAGVLVALTVGNPYPTQTSKIARVLLSASVIGLGAGMDLRVVAIVGLHGLGYTALTIGVAIGLGLTLGRLLRVPRAVTILITVGTAICGGSAIAAVAPVIAAPDEDTSLALVTVFLLNAIALVVFPLIGRAVGLEQVDFGLWAALAIHDTSSVVGAASHYGQQALAVATAAKLARALWIIPVTLVATRFVKRHETTEGPAPRRPWFIAGFIAAAALATYVPALTPIGQRVAEGAHYALGATLFLVGLGLTRPALKRLGARPLILGVALWLTLASATLAVIVWLR
ncbi:putative sulfate exporter family transporter [soil metagenome]